MIFNMFPSLKMGLFLASRYILRTNVWTTLLVTCVMTLTFINVIAISGILVGLPEGASQAFKAQYAGDILISRKPETDFIEKSTFIQDVLNGLSEVKAYSSRYIANGSIEVDYQKNIDKKNRLPDQAGSEIVGIDPLRERQVTALDEYVYDGTYLTSQDDSYVMVGVELIETFLPGATGLETVSHINVGDKVRIAIGNLEKEFTVKALIKSKAGQVDRRVYMHQDQLRKMMQRSDYNIDEIAVLLHHPEKTRQVINKLNVFGLNRYAQIKTAEESLGVFLEEIKGTFSILGNVIGSAGLLVASITVFIVIFITAFSRKKYIGILKGIGINEFSIISSYVFLSLFYAVLGISFGLVIVYFFLVAYFAAYPIDFPFSDGILVVTPMGTFVRSILILTSTVVAGYIPAKMIIRKPPLEAILDR